MSDLNHTRGTAMIDEPLALLAEAFGGEPEPDPLPEPRRLDDDASAGIGVPGMIAAIPAWHARTEVRRL